MKLTVILVNSVAILILLSGVGVVLDKMQTASLSNPFIMRTASLTKAKPSF